MSYLQNQDEFDNSDAYSIIPISSRFNMCNMKDKCILTTMGSSLRVKGHSCSRGRRVFERPADRPNGIGGGGFPVISLAGCLFVLYLLLYLL